MVGACFFGDPSSNPADIEIIFSDTYFGACGQSYKHFYDCRLRHMSRM